MTDIDSVQPAQAQRYREKANSVRALIPSVESFNSDNTGVTGDVDANSSTSGYDGMNLTILKSTYDQSIDANASTTPYLIPSAFVPTGSASVDYCVTATIGGWTAFKHGPAGTISVVKASSFAAATCSFERRAPHADVSSVSTSRRNSRCRGFLMIPL